MTMAPEMPDPPICSARGCRSSATWTLGWNNPRLHAPERRKTWLACDEHRESLSSFLDVRGFLRECVAGVPAGGTAGNGTGGEGSRRP